ncbi:LuxR C-terminal-related transcriptional regulator [Dactylosporangium sp. NPDC051484]|uniref:LuxR C-terminal-related transcriptional regulator n=1 Tax=Dactylosporangium sp. NPDC051484 TaxID=3154942 RepID=UPI00344F8082
MSDGRQILMDDLPGRMNASGVYLRRQRLLSALNAASDAAVRTVYGPAGAGKTMLLLDWLDQLPPLAPAVYVELTGANTARVRWRQVKTTGASGGTGGAWPSGPWPRDLDPAGGGLLSLPEAAGMLDRLPAADAGPRDEPATVVVDGIDAVTDPRMLDRLIGGLLRHRAPGTAQARKPAVQVVLAGRHPPDPPGLPNLGHAALPADAAFDPRELQLTCAETAQLCALRGLDAAPADVRHLYAVTGGWAAGVAIAIDTLQNGPYDMQQHLDEILRTGADLDAYVEDDVLAGLAPDQRDAVEAASILATVNAELLTALTGRPDSASLLAALAEHRRVFVELDDVSGWYGLPRLWRAALHHRLLTTAPDRLHDLHRTAAAWYAEHRQPAEEHRHAAAALDQPIGEPRARARGTGADTRRRPGTAAGALFEYAWLALQAGDPFEARQRLTAALSGPADGGAAPRLKATRMGALADHQQGLLRAAARAAADVRATLHRHGVADSRDEGWALLTLAAVAVLRGQPERAHRRLDDLLVQNWPPDPALLAGETFHRLLATYQTGQPAAALAAAERLIAEDADTLVLPGWAPRAARIELLTARGFIHDAGRHLDADADRFPPVVAALAAARIALATAHRPGTEAERILRPFLGEREVCLVHAVELRLLIAAGARRAGRPAVAERFDRDATTLASGEQLRHPFIVLRLLAGATRAAPPPPNGAPAAHGPGERPELTQAESSVLGMLVGFLTVGEIAGELHLSPNTVKTHLAAVYRKLGVHRRRDAVRRARELDLL